MSDNPDEDREKAEAARHDRARAASRSTDELVASISREQARRHGSVKAEPEAPRPGLAALLPGEVRPPAHRAPASGNVQQRAMRMLMEEMRRNRSRR